MPLADHTLDCLVRDHDLIAPCADYGRDDDGVSYGLDAHGYSARVGRFVLLRTKAGQIELSDVTTALDLAPGAIAHCYTLERFALPWTLIGRSTAKSYWQREKDLFVMDGTLNAGWSGHLLVEVKNLGFRPVTLRRGAGIVHIAFDIVDAPRRRAAGRYEGQGVQ